MSPVGVQSMWGDGTSPRRQAYLGSMVVGFSCDVATSMVAIGGSVLHLDLGVQDHSSCSKEQ